MSVFKDEEIKFMEKWGNEKAQEEWMGDWNKSLYPEPDKKDMSRMKEFFRLKYTERRFNKKVDSDTDESDSDSESAKKKKAAAKKKKKEE